MTAKPKLSAASLRVLRSMQGSLDLGEPKTTQAKAKAKDSGLAIDLYCDGASRGNPGPASAGALLLEQGSGKTLARLGKRLGRATNNEAEYGALLLGLQEALDLGAVTITVHADSELVIKQVKGIYRVKHPVMQQRHQEALRLLAKFKTWRAVHVPREKNAEADRLANEALDAPPGPQDEVRRT
jgi:ribonuclease HI